ncbi:hypothetical protein D0Z03_000285 [Geotrichum reessii]|nr:hypothetical protein D0Z03_000285 [Galactomyces reessii]
MKADDTCQTVASAPSTPDLPAFDSNNTSSNELLTSSTSPRQANTSIENRHMNPMVFALTILTSVCGFLFGYDTGYISGALVVIGSDLGKELTSGNKELITSATSLGALIFALIGGPLADWAGRKWVISGANILFIIGAIIQVSAHRLWAMIVGRFIMGWGVGLASLVAPLYISEMAPARFRGRLVVINVLAITGGQLVAYAISAGLYHISNGWRILVGLSMVPAAFQMVLFIFMPETPRYLIRRGRVDEARKVLMRTYQDSSTDEIEDKIDELVKYNLFVDEGSNSGFAWLQRWKDGLIEVHRVPSNFRAVVITCGLQGIQQFSGFNALMYFSATIFQSVGFNNPTSVSLIIAGTNFVFTLVAFACIDRIGRRRILLVTIVGMIAGLVLASVCFHFIKLDLNSNHNDQSKHGAWSAIVIIAMLLYTAFYAGGIGNVPWQQSEMFPMKVRGVGTSLATATNWAGSLVISSTFLTMLQRVTPTGTFAFYSGLCLLGWIFVYFFYPETAYCTLEEVQSLLTGGFNVKESVERNKIRRREMKNK